MTDPVRHKAWREANKERLREYHKRRYREKVYLASKAYYEKNKAKILARKKADYWARRDAHVAQARSRYWADPQRSRQRRREWSLAHPDKAKASKRKDYLKHGDAYRARTHARRLAKPDVVMREEIAKKYKGISRQMLDLLVLARLARRKLRQEKHALHA